MMKPTLVLLPGLLCDAALWSHQRTNLWGLVEIVIPDLSGGDDIAQLASSVLAVLPDRFSLAGLSMGGYVALEILNQGPERIERLALIATSPRAVRFRQARPHRGLIALSIRGEVRG